MALRCSSTTEVVAVVGLLVASGCAARREARMRRAWNGERHGVPAPSDTGATENGDDPKTGPATAELKQGWARVEELLDRTVDVLTSAPSPEVLAELASRWCEVEPIPRQTEHGAVRVCYLNPPVRIQGVALTLEMNDTGIVGFVAPELDVTKSRAVATEARTALDHLCTTPWSRVDETLDVQTCTVGGGSTLAVGRVQPQPETDRWQVSVAVLGAI